MRKFFLILTLAFLSVLKVYSENEFLEESLKFDEITEEIYLEAPMSFKYDTGYREIKKMSAKDELSKTRKDNSSTIFKKDNISFETSYKKGKNNYLLDSLENRQMIKYDKNKLILTGGISNSYEYSDLSKNTRKIFFSPQYRVNNHITLGLNNAINTKSMTFEQGANIRYKPYFLKNTSFGLNGSIKQREDNVFTRKFELNSEFYLW